LAVSAVLDNRFKLVEEAENRVPLRCYELESDPKELHNLAKGESHETTHRKLPDKLANHLSNNLAEERFQIFREKGHGAFKGLSLKDT
jgi:hypothetical protein